MTNDGELLRRYADAQSDEAFAELVRRHVDLVYSSALRQVNGDAHLAQDVAQTVFTDLARKAASLSHRPVLTGWLYTSTHFAATKAVRAECRRRARELEAQAMNELLQPAGNDFDWEKLRPMLDQIMHRLQASDRDILLMRYFENRPYSEIARVLGVNEDTARKRSDRALEKLRGFLSRQGLGATATLATALSCHAVQMAPAGLAAILTQASATTAVAGTATTFSILKIMTMTKFQIGTISAVLVAGLLAPWLVQNHRADTLLAANIRLRQQADVSTENVKLARLRAIPDPATALTPAQFSELMKLRGEAGVQKNTLDRLRAELTARKNSISARALRAPASTNYFSKDSWATAGAATPEAAVQSLSYRLGQAMSHRDLKALADLIPAGGEKPADHFAGKSEQEIAEALAEEAKHFGQLEGLRILNRKIIAPDEVLLTYYYDGGDGFGSMQLKRSGQEWKWQATPKTHE